MVDRGVTTNKEVTSVDEEATTAAINGIIFDITDTASNYSEEFKTTTCIEDSFKTIKEITEDIDTLINAIKEYIAQIVSIGMAAIPTIPTILNGIIGNATGGSSDPKDSNQDPATNKTNDSSQTSIIDPNRVYSSREEAIRILIENGWSEENASKKVDELVKNGTIVITVST